MVAIPALNKAPFAKGSEGVWLGYNLFARLTREDFLGDMFYAGTVGYFGQYTALSYLTDLQAKAYRHLAAGYGNHVPPTERVAHDLYRNP